MRTAVLVDLVKLLGLFGIIWAVFAYFPIFPDDPGEMISIEKEEQLGDLMVEEILGNHPDYQTLSNPVLDSAMKVMADRLLDQIGLTDYDFDIRVVDNDMVNAITLPAGHIFVFAGLIEFSEHPEEVAAVLAHEIGHVEKRHVVNKLIKEVGLTVIATVLTGGDPVIVTEVSRGLFSSMFDRSQEREADQYALDLLVKAKIAPTSLAAFFRRLKRQYGSVYESLEILSTHPHTNSRIKAALEYEVPEGFEREELGLDWEAVKESLSVSTDGESVLSDS